MGHGKLRHENNCLNCNAIVQGTFCGICGQENLDTKESIGALIRHFFEDITHFDGKFFSTLKYLLFKPGYLPAAYMNGKRATYLNPVRMYVFTSFVFFLIMFSFNNFDKKLEEVTKKENIVQINLTNMADSVYEKISRQLNNDSVVPKSVSAAKIARIKKALNKENNSAERYRRSQDTAKIKDNWVERTISEKLKTLQDKYNGNKTRMGIGIINTFIHYLPQLLFVSLPLMTLILGILYARGRKFNLVNHGIFLIHYYVFMFVVTLLMLGIERVNKILDLGMIDWIQTGIGIYIMYYFYKALSVFYRQGRAKTILKYFIFFCSFLFVLSFLSIVFLAISVFKF